VLAFLRVPRIRRVREIGRCALVDALDPAPRRVTRYWIWFPVLITGIVVSVLLWPVGALLAAAAIALVVAKPDLFGMPPR
jgi:hypothetical protein